MATCLIVVNMNWLFNFDMFDTLMLRLFEQSSRSYFVQLRNQPIHWMHSNKRCCYWWNKYININDISSMDGAFIPSIDSIVANLPPVSSNGISFSPGP
jgi:hypothetical protein